MNLDFWHSLILAGIIQGFVLSCILISRKDSVRRKYLGLLVLSFALDNFQYLMADSQVVSSLTFATVIFLPYGFLCAPLYLLYVLSMNGRDIPGKKRKLWLFLPFLSALLYASVVKVSSLFLGIERLSRIWLNMEMFFEFACLLLDSTVLIYLVRKHQLFPNLRIVNWLLLLACASWLVVTLADYWYDTEYWEIVYINISVIIYGLGHAELIRRKKPATSPALRQLPQDEPRHALLTQLDQLVLGQKKYLDPDLNLENLAQELNVSKSHLSRLFNQERQSSFPDYLNKLRVEAAKTFLADPSFDPYTISSIGLEAGFNSKTTFNTTFKKWTGMTPSAYKQSLQDHSEESLAS